MKNVKLLLAGAAMLATSSSAFAITVTDNFNATITIVDECKITTLEDLNFGSDGVLDTTLTDTAQVGVICSRGTAYTMSFDSAVSDLTINDTMNNGSNTVSYTAVLSSAGATGNGQEQTYQISGTVPPQATPPAGVYTDTQTLYVTY